MTTDKPIPSPETPSTPRPASRPHPLPNSPPVPVDIPTMTAMPVSATSPAAAPATAPAPLTPDQIKQFQAALTRSKKLRRATGIAVTDGYLTAIGAASTLLLGLTDPSAILLGLALVALSVNAFRGARKLKRFDLTGPRLLALNQVALAAIIVLYCAYSFWQFSRGNNDMMKELSDPQLASLGVDFKSLGWTIMIALYGGLAAGSVIIQGLTALYYITRKNVITDYLAQTPPWIVSIQKAQAGA